MKSCEGAPSMSKPRSQKEKLLLAFIAIITLLQLSFWYNIGSVQDLDDCAGGAMSSPHCAEAELFRKWKAAQAAGHNASHNLSQGEKLQVPVELLLAVSEAGLHALSTSTAGPAGLGNDLEQNSGWNNATSGEQVNSSWSYSNRTDVGEESIEVRVQGHLRRAKESKPSAERASEWAQDLVTLQDSMHAWDMVASQKRYENPQSKLTAQALESRLQNMSTLQNRFENPQSDSTTQASTSEPQSLLDQIYDFGRDLCSHPSRRNHKICAEFRKTHEERMVSSSDDMDYYSPPNLSTTRLNWLDVESWQSRNIGRRSLRASSAPSVVTKTQLKQGSWYGSLPRVACVAVLPSGRDADTQMQYFVQGFMRQDYEGPKQLIIVYHHHDSHAQDVVEKHADGLNVLAVRAMGADKDLSTTAYRYGAWTADADVIMRYDFGAWHHPARISMQVRALAVAKRPASRLLRWTARDYAQGGEAQVPPDGQVQALGEASLAGDKRWMAKHWFPLLTGERQRLLNLGDFVTNVDMAQLLVYNAAV